MWDQTFLTELIKYRTYQYTDKVNCSLFLQKKLLQMGFKVRVINNYGSPFILGTLDLGAPNSILFYSHYDVKPEGDITAWQTPPFTPFYDLKQNKVFARGAGDAKGQIFSLIKGIELALNSSKRIEYNITILFDGDEESNSPGLAQFCHDVISNKKYDSIIINDSHWYKDNPVIYTGTRGQASYRINYTLESMNENLHAGNYGGLIAGAAREFIFALTQVLNSIDNVINEINIQNVPVNSVSLTYLNSGDAERSIIPKSAYAKIDVRFIHYKIIDKIEKLLYEARLLYGIEYCLIQKSDGFYNEGNPLFLKKMKEIVKNVTQKDLLIKDYCRAYLPMKKLSFINGTQYILPIAQSDEHNHAANENISLYNIECGVRIISELLTN